MIHTFKLAFRNWNYSLILLIHFVVHYNTGSHITLIWYFLQLWEIKHKSLRQRQARVRIQCKRWESLLGERVQWTSDKIPLREWGDGECSQDINIQTIPVSLLTAERLDFPPHSISKDSFSGTETLISSKISVKKYFLLKGRNRLDQSR